ncbi:hypothetical protein [Hyphomonas pacifica]|uniref:Uncharacterized protein n=1 Tax=Hyphomonas pacifica TaxID=1280941 RepID=A0A062U3T7_9PROT|nr:hypothetical protein [Hyphomonas pacifica]KCZ50805.1 hypothetical protein HY2_13240 [Hyphomonas pacifica]RAN33318.1 hypothetical protein HY3_13310 [Hyphomonas pacifica]RAN36977.1 hypothetical protein HY11_10240 [Hyphomonas pacifica]
MERDTKIALAGAAIAKRERKRQEHAVSGGRTEKGNLMRMLFGIFPLLVIPVALYNLLALGFGGPMETANEFGEIVRSETAPILELLNGKFVGLPMISGVDWILTKGDAILLLAVVFLFLEILKSTSTGTSTIMNHAVSMILFIVCLIQFLLLPNFATSTFFILMSMTLLDVLAGVVVTIVSARRDFGVAGDI